MRHLLYVTTVPVTANYFLRGHLAAMQEAGFRVSVASSPGPDLWEVGQREGVDTFPISIPREISAVDDAIALTQLTDLFVRLQPDIVNASTPKGGLLGMLAARLTGVPRRIYMLRGLRLETAQGGLRSVLGMTERAAASAATDVVCVSHSLQTAYIEAGYAPAQKCQVLCDGSSNGVNAARYARTPDRVAEASRLRAELAIPVDAPVIGFAGRLVEDKGIVPLLDALEQVRETHPTTALVLVGDSLAGDQVDPAIRARVQALGAHVLPFMRELGPFYAMLDVLAFPSYREGFPNVPLEASCAGLPVVGFASTGVVDAIVDGVTGSIVSRDGLAQGLLRYLNDPELARTQGEAGRERATADFAPQRIWNAWKSLYARGHFSVGSRHGAV